MKKAKLIQKEIEKTLQIADEVQPQQAPSYLYARLMRKMEKQTAPAEIFHWSPAWRWALAGFSLLIMLNIGSLLQEWNQNADQKYEVLADRYYGESRSFYDFIAE